MKVLLIGIVLTLLVSTALLAETILLSEDNGLNTSIVISNDDLTVVEFSLGSFTKKAVTIDEGVYYLLNIEEEPFLLEESEPQLPYVNRSIIIPNRAQKEVVLVDSKYTEFEINVIPSKGSLYRHQDPAQIPYKIGEVYQKDEFYPGEYVALSDPFIIRDYRGQTVTFYPFQYNPVTGVVRVYEQMTVEIRTVGDSNHNIIESPREFQSREFTPIYENLFLNYPLTRYPILEETGRKIVICYDPYLEAVEPYVEWKNQKGIPTELYPLSHIGTTPGEIKNFITEQYQLDDGLTFVQLVGNGSNVPTFRFGTQNSIGAADPIYSLIDGDDNYPDIFIGRFSANSISQVVTQVERSIFYERDLNGDNNWLMKATGIASGEGSDPTDIDHMNAIRQGLMIYGYNPVDQIYYPNATLSRVRDAVNEGRGLINYAGHGRATSWSTSGFNRIAVDNLVNDRMLPFVFSVACQNGNFTDNPTSFAEAWLRATNDETGVPTGGIAFYGSSVNQLWYPPLIAQTEAARLISQERMSTIGGICFNAASKMIHDRGTQGANEFKNWHIFGDVSLQLRTASPREFVVVRMPEVFVGTTSYQVETNAPNALVGISYNGEVLGSGYTNNQGHVTIENVAFPYRPTTVEIVVTAQNYVAYIGTIDIVSNEGPYVILDGYTVKGHGHGFSVEYGDLVGIDLNLMNVGIGTAEGVTAEILTDDVYAKIIQGNRDFGDIEPSDQIEINDAFTVQIAENIPNQHLVLIRLIITDDDENTWNWRFSFLVNAPHLQAGIMIVDDSQFGNSDGVFDPGETIVLTFPALNTGNAQTRNAVASLVVGSPMVELLSSPTVNLQPVKIGETVYPTFTVAASPEIAEGSIIPFGFVVSSGMYYAQKTYRIPVGTILEDFSTGDFTAFEWEFAGHQPWVIDSLVAHQGNYSARSGDITHSQTSVMSITQEVTEPSEITFYRRVSSEMGYDFLSFYINNYLVGEWSGDFDWVQQSYPVAVGENTFKWTYRKDIVNDFGYDCAWIDTIHFPISGSSYNVPIFMAYPVRLDYGTVELETTKSAIFHIRNFGSVQMTGRIETYDGFEIVEDVFGAIDETGRNEDEHVYNYSIPPESNIPFKLVFHPTEERDYSGDIIITSNDEYRSQTVIRVTATGGYVSVEEEIVTPLKTELIANFPNPFNPSTTISYALQENAHVSLEVFNILGQKVITLVNEQKEAGRHSIIWDGSNHQGSKVSSGIYFYRMKTGSYENVRRMLYLK